MSSQKRQPPVDVLIARLAERQYGVVSLQQLREMGLSGSTVRSRVASGRLHRVFRGVFAVGHGDVNGLALDMAAVLACGPGAVISHRSAAALIGLRPSSRRTVDVTARRRSGRPHPGIALHRANTLLPRDVMIEDRIPCTTVARTLLDLAEVLDRAGLERAIERAEKLRIFDLGALDDVLARAHGRHGAPRLRAALRAYREPMTRSELERRFLAICRAAGFPDPLVNAQLGDIQPDFMWPEHRLIVETDGFEDHGTRRAFSRDRRRDRELKLERWEVLRFTWQEVADEPELVVRHLSPILRTADRGRRTAGESPPPPSAVRGPRSSK